MFAALVFDRDPLRAEDLPAGLMQWLQSAGGFATVGLVLFLLLGLPRLTKEERDRIPGWMKSLFLVSAVLSAIGYVVFAIVGLANINSDPNSAGPIWAFRILAFAAGCAIVPVITPFLLGVSKMRFRRIYALAKLSFKEAIRRRVLYAFSGMLLVFLFASWFVPSDHKDQVRTYVGVVFAAMTYLMLFTALLVSAFSIPQDIRQQTIHTIVTKPVERFEIVLGRFFGFLALMTVVLVAMTGVSLLYVFRGIHPEAAAESLEARVPLYGDLRFENTDSERQAVNVGREWEYRSYISKPLPGQATQFACWDFPSLPGSLGKRDEVRCEYSFDVYRTTKGDEGRDVFCIFRFSTWRFKKGNEEAFRKEREALLKTGAPEAKVNNDLAEKYGFFELPGQPVTDYRTLALYVPGGLFKNAVAADPERESELKSLGTPKVPLTVRVACDSPTQYVGMARYDLYFRLDDSSGGQTSRFAFNFFKGAFGLWLQLALIIGVTVCLSTYLNGVITLLVTAVLFFGGLGRNFVQEVAIGKNVGGGPVEAMVRMTRRELSGASFADSASIGDQIVSKSDDAFRLAVRLIINIIPDVERYDLSAYVAEGFNISWVQMGLVLLMLVGYLLPWGVLAYYLLHWREIANPQ